MKRVKYLENIKPNQYCWSKGAFGTESPRALVSTVLLHTQASFGTRGKAELWNITNGDIIPGPNRQAIF